MPSDKMYRPLQPYTTRRPKLPTVLSISQYTPRNCATHIPIYSRYIKERFLPTPTQYIAVHRGTKLQPSRGAPNDVNVLPRRSICLMLMLLLQLPPDFD